MQCPPNEPYFGISVVLCSDCPAASSDGSSTVQDHNRRTLDYDKNGSIDQKPLAGEKGNALILFCH